MAAAVVTVAIEDILHSLEEGMKLGQQWGVKREFMEIQDLLSSIRRMLPEVEDRYGRSFELQKWVRNLKEAAFDVEDLLEELSAEDSLLQRKRKVRRLFGAIDRLTFRWGMRDKLRGVTKQLRDLIEPYWVALYRNIPYAIGEAHEEARVVRLIGRHNAKREVMNMLLHWGMERDLPVLVLQGDLGIGKTALVREVLSEPGLSTHFEVILWVNASPPFDESRMARDIVASLTEGGATEEENAVEEQLLLRIGKLLDGKNKYLFILDNLSVQHSERQRWLRFWSFLDGGAKGSKILVTTRDREGMSYEEYYKGMSYQEFYLNLQGLTQEESLELLLKTASKGGVEEIIDPAKLYIAEDVAAKCNGNPLILRAVGDHLSLQDSKSDWSSLPYRLCARHEDLFSTLFHGGYPYAHLSPMVKRYKNLPPTIKQCFGLCSLFSRGHVMDRQTLAELWIALGYIKSSNEDNRSLEDIADNYFNRLLMEELFHVKKFDTFGEVRSVVLHPDAEDLARFVMGWECQELKSNYFPLEEKVEKARHISVIDYRKFSACSLNFRGLRTVLYFVDDHHKTEALCHLIPTKSCVARAYDFRHLNMKAVPKAVCKLKLLRYLDLSDNRRIETLPPAITGLPNLQTLKLSGCWALKELPPDMRKMVSLRHLYINGCRKLCLMPKGLGNLRFLNILTDFILSPDDSSSVDSAKLADLCKLNDLRGSLRITNLGYSEATREKFMIQGLLDRKSSLESLELIFRNLPTDKSLLDKLRPHSNLKGLRIHNYRATLFPEWMAQSKIYLPNLVEIALIDCKKCEYLPQFDQLAHLKSLIIQGLPNLLRIESGSGLSLPDFTNNAQSFGELSLLCIRDCPKLEHLPLIPHLTKLTLENVSEQLFGHPFWVASSLKTLRLENIELLHHLPEEWPGIPSSLEELHIRNCPKLNYLWMMMPRLMKLTLANVNEELFKQPCHLPRLKTLRLENIELPDHLSELWPRDLTCLKELHIGSCPSLVSLSPVMMYLENLESLSIWNCKNYNLSMDEQGNYMMELQGLKSLKFLTIYKALKMVHLPEWLSHVYTLRFLFLRSCPSLVALPEWIGNLQSLKLIELVHCPLLRDLPAWTSEFTNDYPRKLSIIGCPHLQSKGIEHSRNL